MAKRKKRHSSGFGTKKVGRHLRRGSHGRGRRGKAIAEHMGGKAKHRSGGRHKRRGGRKSGRKSRKSHRG